MKVVIVGGGKVGELLCADFSNTFEEVTLIDTNEQRVEKLVETYDINGLLGNGANYDNLVEVVLEKLICLSLLLLAMKLI